MSEIRQTKEKRTEKEKKRGVKRTKKKEVEKRMKKRKKLSMNDTQPNCTTQLVIFALNCTIRGSFSKPMLLRKLSSRIQNKSTNMKKHKYMDKRM